MIIPVRCFTCGKVIASKWETYCEKVAESEKVEPPESKFHKNFDPNMKGKILDDLGLTKICCRRHMLGHVDIVDII